MTGTGGPASGGRGGPALELDVVLLLPGVPFEGVRDLLEVTLVERPAAVGAACGGAHGCGPPLRSVALARSSERQTPWLVSGRGWWLAWVTVGRGWCVPLTLY